MIYHPDKTKSNKSLANKKALNNQVTIMDYSGAHLEEKRTGDLAECIPYKDTETVTWINIDNVPPLGFIKELGLGFDLHPVILEDITSINQRPKIEILDDYIYLTFKMLTVDRKDRVSSEQVSMIVAGKFVITFQQGVEGDTFEVVRNLIRKEKTRIRTGNTDYLAYELIASVVESYFEILESFGERIEELEDKLMVKTSSKMLKVIHNLKRDIISLRRSVWPLREVVNILERGDTHLVKKNTKIYLRDLYDRMVQVVDTMESYREILSGMLDIYLSSVNNRMNAVIKVLTIITTIFMPLSFLAGVYGMNFKFMPGLNSIFGFPTIVLFMFSVFLMMLLYFWRKEWI